jgi:hypothetical protein
MRKPLIAALGLVSLVFLSNIASASDPKDIGAKITPEHLKSVCAGNSGTYTPEAEGSARCNFKRGRVIECNASAKCMGWNTLQ